MFDLYCNEITLSVSKALFVKLKSILRVSVSIFISILIFISNTVKYPGKLFKFSLLVLNNYVLS